MSDSPQYVTCHCEHCDGGIEFDASGFDKGETRAVECPHCHHETVIFVPEQEKTPTVISQTEKTNESAQLTPYIGFKCQICDQVIEAKNVRLGESIISPHCKCSQFIPRKNLEFVGAARKQTDPDIACARQEDSSEPLESLRKIAEQGNATAQLKLARMYANGCNVPQDEAEAMKWFRKAAEQNYADGQLCLGWCYANGQGVAKDEAEAVKWYRKAAAQNHAQAQCNLGVCYADGKGVAKDEVEAVKWYRKAAEQNCPAAAQAQYTLYSMYDTGQGVPKDDVAAVEWLRKNAEQGYAVTQALLGLY
jgi:hypothetical protein